jgi:hypothetical protein
MTESRKRRENLTQEEQERHKKVRLGELQIGPAIGHEGGEVHPEPLAAPGETPMTRNEAADGASALAMSAHPSASRKNPQTAPGHKTSPPICATSIFATGRDHRNGLGWHRHWRRGRARSPIKVGSHPGERIASGEPSKRVRLLGSSGHQR